MKTRVRRPPPLEITILFKKLEEEKSQEAFDKLFYKLSCIPQRSVRDYKWAQNQNDLLNTGYETLIKAIRTYDFSKCNNFFLWGEKWIVKEIAKAKFKEKVWIENQIKSTDISEYANILSDPVCLEENYEIEEQKYIAYKIINLLNPSSKKFIQKLYGLNGTDIVSLRTLAHELGISTKKAWKLKNQILEDLNDAYKKSTCQ